MFRRLSRYRFGSRSRIVSNGAKDSGYPEDNMPTLQVPYVEGMTVQLFVPENPMLHGTKAKIKVLTDWGAYLDAPAAASGEFRALFKEMIPSGTNGRHMKHHGYTGDICDTCGSFRVRHNGTCRVCDDCGSTSGCS
jgi:hypothetical protein